ncbi:MAG: PqqD family protein [Gemmatimonadales bacterium]
MPPGSTSGTGGTPDLMALIPRRAVYWEETGDRVTLIRRPPETEGWRRLLDRLLFELQAHRIRLDEMGSATWRLMDGEHTVADIAQHLRETFGEAVEPAEERLAKLLQALYREHLITFAEDVRAP